MSRRRKPHFRPAINPVPGGPGETIELVNELPIDPSIGTVEFIDYSKLPPDGPEYLRSVELAAAFEAGRRAAAGSPTTPPPATGT